MEKPNCSKSSGTRRDECKLVGCRTSQLRRKRTSNQALTCGLRSKAVPNEPGQEDPLDDWTTLWRILLVSSVHNRRSLRSYHHGITAWTVLISPQKRYSPHNSFETLKKIQPQILCGPTKDVLESSSYFALQGSTPECALIMRVQSFCANVLDT